MAKADKPRFLIKHSSIEFGEEWWFLDEVYEHCWYLYTNTVDDLRYLKDNYFARFIKRYSSEEELEIDVLLRYGDVKFEIKTLEKRF